MLAPGERFPDLDLPDHTGRSRTLSELAGGDPLVLLASRGWWCPKEQRYLRELTRLQDEFEVVNFGGAVTVALQPDRFDCDPFARIFPGTVVETDLFAYAPPPCGPAIERYAGAPWPGGSF